jgi:aspartyl-tRNA(Asn)/glutamyl-tRNA(Gln) amidotransferase subunit C
MTQTTTITSAQVSHIAKLANLSVNTAEQNQFATAFTETLTVVDTLKKIDTSNTEPTHQVTDLENVFRDDRIQESRQFSQEQALRNAAQTHNGYFVVERILEND